ncbi:zinc finger protein 37 [Folsomia candida]|uniref:zinc finger protein 37 n=1 Tax=Folsomia candida TaxID=158441 RepID=UPI000B8F3210|nr:zinc finger protein 37 [Folsomia candida]
MEQIVVDVGDFSTSMAHLILSINVLLKSTCEIEEQLRQCLQQLIDDDFPNIQNKLGLIQSYHKENEDKVSIKSEEDDERNEEMEESFDWIVIPNLEKPDNLEDEFENTPETTSRIDDDDDENYDSQNLNNSSSDDHIPEEKITKLRKRTPRANLKTNKSNTPIKRKGNPNNEKNLEPDDDNFDPQNLHNSSSSDSIPEEKITKLRKRTSRTNIKPNHLKTPIKQKINPNNEKNLEWDEDDNLDPLNLQNSDDDDYIPEEKVKKPRTRKPRDNPKTKKLKTPSKQKKHPNCESLLCQNCGKSYRSKYYLGIHMATHDANYIPGPGFECDTCHKSFPYQVSLKKHKIAVHGEGPKLLCPQCGALFKHPDVLRRHVLNVHEQVRPHVCPNCPKSFKMKTHLQYHLKTHDPQSTGRRKERSLNLERKGINPVRCKFNADEFSTTS